MCFHVYSCAEPFAPRASLIIQCVIDDALLATMPDIDQALLQFIYVMNLVDSLLYFSP